MTTIKTRYIAQLGKVVAITALASFLHVGASAQSTPIPKQASSKQDSASHDHSSHEQTEQTPNVLLDGTYSEIDGDHAIGSTTAPITMIIYASVTCPHCASWFNSVWPDVKKNYVEKNKLRVVFREFPTAPANIAVIGFQIANCAPEGQYFSMIEHQMSEQDNIFTSLKAGTGKATYLEIAKKAGLENETAMNTCIQSETGMERLNKSMALANSAKVNTVPNFIINGELSKESSNYLPLSKQLDKLIARGFSPMR